LAWLILLAEALIIGMGAYVSLAAGAAFFPLYALSLVAVIAVFHLFPRWLSSFLVSTKAAVETTGDRWTIGNYSEAELRVLANNVTKDLPTHLRRIRVVVADLRNVAAWTWLDILSPANRSTKQIVVTSGSLHYLQPDEMQAVLMHEIAHHDSKNRVFPWNGGLLTDVSLHAIASAGWSLGVDFGTLAVLFLVMRYLIALVCIAPSNAISRVIEHRCDLAAASHVGAVPLINALLKTGEDGELTEAVLVWAARDLLYRQDLDLNDLVHAFLDARPHGRIFHDNLIRHANELTKLLTDQSERQAKRASRRKKRPNIEFEEFINERRAREVKRIRWRRFDADRDGVLQSSEVLELCKHLNAEPDKVLFNCQGELAPTSHPSFRDRILTIYDATTKDLRA
jgi:Zn-dependent protease with chaperone function